LGPRNGNTSTQSILRSGKNNRFVQQTVRHFMSSARLLPARTTRCRKSPQLSAGVVGFSFMARHAALSFRNDGRLPEHCEMRLAKVASGHQKAELCKKLAGGAFRNHQGSRMPLYVHPPSLKLSLARIDLDLKLRKACPDTPQRGSRKAGR
jgi:hypothetical protein